jgi:two-component system response regulator RegX3
MAQRLLIVEDDPDSAEALGMYLKLEGFSVEWASSGAAALRAVSRTDARELPDVVLLDLSLPDMTGLEAGRLLKARSGVPIVLLSARQNAVLEDAARRLGAAAALRKPCDLRQLVTAIAAALDHNGG